MDIYFFNNNKVKVKEDDEKPMPSIKIMQSYTEESLVSMSKLEDSEEETLEDSEEEYNAINFNFFSFFRAMCVVYALFFFFA